MNDTVMALLREQDTYAAIEQIERQPDPLAVAQSYLELMRDLYWKQKDLPAVIAMARAGIQHGLAAARAVEARDPDQALKLRSSAKGLAYDLGSFTWPGWDEPGIAIDPSQQAIGLDAARANLRLARELRKDDLPISRAYWLLGAHLLAAGDHDAARASFREAARHAQAAGARADELLCQGFACLVTRLSSPAGAARDELAAIQAQLAALEHGPGFAQQIETAQRVFSARGPAGLK